MIGITAHRKLLCLTAWISHLYLTGSIAADAYNLIVTIVVQFELYCTQVKLIYTCIHIIRIIIYLDFLIGSISLVIKLAGEELLTIVFRGLSDSVNLLSKRINLLLAGLSVLVVKCSVCCLNSQLIHSL